MAKKKTAPKRVEINLPAPHDSALPEELVIVPVLMATAAVEPLPEAIGPVRCVLTMKETFWGQTPYIVLAAAPGHVLPEALRTGQEVDVQFSPPKEKD
jgi:hypothetical protein